MSELKILLVDDDLAVLDVMIDLLQEGGGCQVRCANSAAGALDAVRTSRSVDVVITDYNMPGMNGLELARELQRMERCPEAIWIITGLSGGQYEDIVSVASAIGVRVFQKPMLEGLWDELAALRRCSA